jgi:hypothetical protein
MYINRKVRRYRKGDGTFSNSINDCKFDEFGCPNGEWVETVVAYWRKANAIHKWLVDAVQNGEDDCREADIDIDTIRELRNICHNILSAMKGWVLRVPESSMEDFGKYYPEKEGFVPEIVIDPDNLAPLDKATDLHEIADTSICEDALPTADGCFFGSTAYNGIYFWQIAKTIRMLDRLIKRDEEDRENGIYPDYTYRASW